MEDEYGTEAEAQAAEAPEATEQAGQSDESWAKKLRNENKNLRSRLKEAQDMVLSSRFDERILSLIPEEVTDFERRVALAEKFNETLSPTQQVQTQTEQAAEETAPEPPSPQELALAAVAKGSDGSTAPSGMPSPEELLAIAKNNPEEYLRLRKAGARLERLPGNLT